MFPKMRPKVEYTDFLFDRGVISFDELIYIGNSKNINEKNRRRNEVLTKREVNKEYMRRLYRNLVIEECEEVYGQGVIIRGIRSASNELGLKENQFIYHDNKSYSEGLAKGLEMKLSTLESVLKTAKEEKDIYKKVFGERLPV